jgi:hypothetical protein
MDWTTVFLIGLGIGFFLMLIQYGQTVEKKEGFKKILEGGQTLFASASGFSMPESLMKDLPEAIEALRTNLNNGEAVHKMVVGFVGIFPAVLVATNDRVFRIYKGKKITSAFLTTNVFAVNYSEISNIIQQEKTFFSCIKIKPKNGEEIEIDKIFDKNEINPFILFVRNSVDSLSSGLNNAPQINNDQILRIGKNGEDLGDMPIKKVKMLLASGHLSLTDLYWDYQLNEWIPLSCCDVVV